MRIISGYLKGHRLLLPKTALLRPTQDKVKESLFNILLNNYIDLNKIKVLDLCCGSGALGLEAWSRGVNSVTFVDANTKYIQKNLEHLKLSHEQNLQVKRQDCRRVFKQSQWDYDWIFFDPPWQEKQLYEHGFKALSKVGFLKAGATFICEYQKGLLLPSLPDSMSIKCYNYGDTMLSLIVKSGGGNEESHLSG